MNKSLSDLFFSLSLLVVFVICAISLLFYQIQGYEQLQASAELSEEQNLPVAYLRTVFHQRTQDEVIQKSMIDTAPCIRIENEKAQTTTYIYVYDGYLRELYVSNTAQVNIEDGDALVPLKELQIDQQGTVFTFLLKDQEHRNTLRLTTY